MELELYEQLRKHINDGYSLKIPRTKAVCDARRFAPWEPSEGAWGTPMMGQIPGCSSRKKDVSDVVFVPRFAHRKQ